MVDWDPLHVNTLEWMNKQNASIFNTQNWVIIERIFIQIRNSPRKTNKPLKITTKHKESISPQFSLMFSQESIQTIKLKSEL